jgi:hypothetical protein
MYLWHLINSSDGVREFKCSVLSIVYYDCALCWELQLFFLVTPSFSCVQNVISGRDYNKPFKYSIPTVIYATDMNYGSFVIKYFSC